MKVCFGVPKGTPSKNSAQLCCYVAFVPDEARIKCKKEAINKKQKMLKIFTK